MGLMDSLRKVRKVFRREQVQTTELIPTHDVQPDIEPITDTGRALNMADRSMKFVLEKLEPSIKNGLQQGFERMNDSMVNELHASEERLTIMMKRLESRMDDLEQRPQWTSGAVAAPRRVKRSDLIAYFGRHDKSTLDELKTQFNASTNTLTNHLNRLIGDGMIARIDHGTYINLKCGDSLVSTVKALSLESDEKSENVKEDAISPEEGLKRLFENHRNV